MDLKVFNGKLGHEKHMHSIFIENMNCCLPRKGEKICINGNIYIIIDVLQDYDLDEYNIFVEDFNWEN